MVDYFPEDLTIPDLFIGMPVVDIRTGITGIVVGVLRFQDGTRDRPMVVLSIEPHKKDCLLDDQLSNLRLIKFSK